MEKKWKNQVVHKAINVFVFIIVLLMIIVLSVLSIDAYISSDNELEGDILNSKKTFVNLKQFYDNLENEKIIKEIDEGQEESAKKYDGYIIQFRSPSLIEKEKPINNQIEDIKLRISEQAMLKKSSQVKKLNNKLLKKEKEKRKILSNYKKELSREHYSVLSDIKRKLDSKNELPSFNPLQGLIDFFKNFLSLNDFLNNIFLTGFSVKTDSKNILSPSAEFYKVFNGMVLNINEEDVEKIKKIPEIKSISPNLEVKSLLMDSVPLIGANRVWQLDSDGNNCTQTEKECLTGKDVTIGIIDTGVDYTHPDLGGCTEPQFLSGICAKVVGGYDFVDNDYNPIDDNGHGTHVAATAAGNGILKGVAPDAKIYAYKVLSASGSGSFSNVIAAIERSVDLNQDGDSSDHLGIISLSLGGNCEFYRYNCGPDDPVSTAIDNVVNAGVVAVVAAGNSGPIEGTILTPGTARKAITVGATDKLDRIALFSSRGPVEWVDSYGNEKYVVKPDILAPGVNICAAEYDNAWINKRCIDDMHVAISGTSMATPHVAGAVALLKQKHPDWNPDKIKITLIQGMDSYNGNDSYSPPGRINISRSLMIENLYFGNLNIVSNPSGAEILGNPTDTGKMIYLGKTPLSTSIVIGNRDIKLKKWGYYDSNSIILNITENSTYNISYDLQKDPQFLEGWPKKVSNNEFSGEILSSPRCVDFDNDGKNEIIVQYFSRQLTGNENLIYVFKENGSLYPGFPINPINTYDNPSHSTPAIGDIDNDGINEIVVATKKKISVINQDGSIKQGWPRNIPGPGEINYGYPVLADIDNDFDLEILIGEDSSIAILRRFCNTNEDCKNYKPGDWECLFNNCFYFDKTLYAFHHDGTYVSGWPIRKKGDTTGISVGDINNDGDIEIVAGSAGFHPDNLWTYLEAFHANGTSLNGFPIPLFSVDTHDPNLWMITAIQPPVIAKMIDNYAIFINPGPVPGIYENGTSIWNQKLFAYIHSGENLTGWPSSPMNQTRGYDDAPLGLISASDVNNDDKIEIISGSFRSCIYVFNESGQHNNKICLPLYDIHRIISKINADINNDGNQEIFANLGKNSSAYDVNGTNLLGFPKIRGNAEFIFEPAICKLSDKVVLILSDNKKIISIYDLNSTLDLSLKNSWPMKYHDALNTGCYNCANLSSFSSFLYYPFEGNANDISGRHNGIIYGANLTNAIGHGYLFNGVNSYIELPKFSFSSNNLIDSVKTLSISFWSKSTKSKIPQTFLSDRYALNVKSNTSNFLIWRWNDDLSYFFSNGTISLPLIFQNYFSGFDNQFVHTYISIDYKNRNVRVFRNGELFSNRSIPYLMLFPNENRSKYIGIYGPFSYAFNGTIDEIKIWDYALTPEKILSEYNKSLCTNGKINCTNGCNISTGICNPGSCIPKNCSQLGKDCGTWPDGCGGYIRCLPCCPNGKICDSLGQCINPLLNNLTAYYPFEGNADDASGNGNNGIVNGASLVNGTIGMAYSFDGVNDYISINNKLIKTSQSKGAYSFWINENASSTTELILMQLMGRSSYPYYCYGIKYNSLANTIYYLDSNYGLGSGYLIYNLSKKWTHIIVSWNETKSYFYINGTLMSIGNNPYCSKPILNSFLIGKPLSNLNFFKGIIDEIKIWNYTLNESEVLMEYQRTNYCTCSDECNILGIKRCNGQTSETCGNFYSNSCFEWGNITNCSYGGCNSSTGECNICIPKTCIQIGKQCGNWSDGCGGILNCGKCGCNIENNSTSLVCRICSPKGQCVANCTPQTCSSLGKQCGTWSDGCGKNITCPICQLGQICNSTGQCLSFNNNQLIAYYAFEGNADDINGSGGNGTVYGANLTNGKIGKGYSFDGINDYIDFGNKVPMQGNLQFTISAWVRINNGAGTQGIISRGNLAGSVREYMLGYSGNKFFWQRSNGTAYDILYSLTDKNPNTWYHTVAWYDGSVMKIFVNGVEEGSKTSTISAGVGTSQLDIGSVPESIRTFFFNGIIDEVKVWNYALNRTEILNEYNRALSCILSCSGKSCGSDGCGGSCGTCFPSELICNASGQCVINCTSELCIELETKSEHYTNKSNETSAEEELISLGFFERFIEWMKKVF